MKRIKLILATVAAMAVMKVAAVSPALADHGIEWETFWWDEWFCWIAWEHESDGDWDIDWYGCVNEETREWWIGVD